MHRKPPHLLWQTKNCFWADSVLVYCSEDFHDRLGGSGWVCVLIGFVWIWCVVVEMVVGSFWIVPFVEFCKNLKLVQFQHTFQVQFQQISITTSTRTFQLKFQHTFQVGFQRHISDQFPRTHINFSFSRHTNFQIHINILKNKKNQKTIIPINIKLNGWTAIK